LHGNLITSVQHLLPKGSQKDVSVCSAHLTVCHVFVIAGIFFFFIWNAIQDKCLVLKKTSFLTFTSNFVEFVILQSQSLKATDW
jgi:hypothetical protein